MQREVIVSVAVLRALRIALAVTGPPEGCGCAAICEADRFRLVVGVLEALHSFEGLVVDREQLPGDCVSLRWQQRREVEAPTVDTDQPAVLGHTTAQKLAVVETAVEVANAVCLQCSVHEDLHGVWLRPTPRSWWGTDPCGRWFRLGSRCRCSHCRYRPPARAHGVRY